MQAFLRNREIDNIYSINIISKTIFFGFAFIHLKNMLGFLNNILMNNFPFRI